MLSANKPALYIKLGKGGAWEKRCLAEGILLLGFNGTPVELCRAGDWESVAAHWRLASETSDAGSARRQAKQIQAFFEAPPEQVFVTFHDRRLWWCQPEGEIIVQADGTHLRHTIDGWHCTSLGGAPLNMERLSGKLLKTEGFRGTICEVEASDYLFRKLNDQLSPEMAEAERAEEALCQAVRTLVTHLTWQDFELLVQLIMTTTGWRQVSVLGRTQKTIDLDLLLPTTGERAFVQIKSKASTTSLADYIARLSDSAVYAKMFFVWHTGAPDERLSDDRVILIGPDKLGRMVVDAGLSSWVREKVG